MRFEPRPCADPAEGWDVIDTKTGTAVVAERYPEEDAEVHAASLNRAEGREEATVPAEVRALGKAIEGFAIEHMLRSVRVFDGDWIVTVEEPSIYDANQRNLTIKYEEFDL